MGGGDVNESENVVKNDQMALKYGFATGTGIHIVVMYQLLYRIIPAGSRGS